MSEWTDAALQYVGLCTVGWYVTPLDLRVDLFTVYSSVYNSEVGCSMLWVTLCLINEYNK